MSAAVRFPANRRNKYLRPLLGITLPNPSLDVSGLYYDKKLKTVPHGLPHPHIDLRFDAMMTDLGLPLLAKHNALDDALMTALMYVKLKNTARV